MSVELRRDGNTPEPEIPATPVPPPTPAPAKSLKKVAVIGAILLGLGLWLVLALLPGILTREPAQEAAATPGQPADAKRIQATLFYVSPDGAELVPVVRDVALAPTPAEQARRIVEAQVQPPAEGMFSAIPKGTTVRGVFLGAHGEAYVDLSPEVRTGHGGGTMNETLAVFAVVNAITSNLPDVSAVQILIDGKEVDSLAGHVDLRQPIKRTTDWIRKGQ